MPCPNRFPKVEPTEYRLAVIGEAPGREEESIGEPFVGSSGRLLKSLMSRAGLDPDMCFFGNVSQDRPPGNEIANFDWDGPEIFAGLNLLANDLDAFKPNLCLLLGNVSIKAFLDPFSHHRLEPGEFKYPVSTWRGSALLGSTGDHLYKCLPSYHPAGVLRNYEWAPMLQFDLKKARRESTFTELHIPKRDLIIPSNAEELCYLLLDILTRKPLISVDIEGGVDSMSCLSISESPSRSFIVPFTGSNEGGHFSIDGEVRIQELLIRVLEDPNIPKVLQNSLYDRFVLQYSYHIIVEGVVDDTMLKHWELYCELEKGLGVQASIYTDEPYYKFERKSGDTKTFWEYCCKDSAVTHEINGKLETKLKECPRSYEHYKFNVDLLNPLLYMELRGILYDWEKAKRRRVEVLSTMFEKQHELDRVTGFGVHGKSQGELASVGRALMKYKRDPSRVKVGYENIVPRVNVLLSKTALLSPSECGELSSLLELHLNVRSKKFTTYIYNVLKLPIQTNEEGRQTASELALITLRKGLQKESRGYNTVDLALQIRRMGTKERMLSIHPDNDGRIRCGYNVVGTETGRLTCYTSPTGSGYNLQTIPGSDRDLFIADPNHWMFQCDLAGADGWTIGAYCKALGDPTMLDDLSQGIKPAKVICLGLRGLTRYLSPHTSREEIYEACKQVKKEDWDYFACKIGIWGTAYLMGPDTLRNNFMEESDGELCWSRSETKDFQRLVFIRYQLKKWHQWRASQLARNPVIVSASGHRRVFFGRHSDILGKALAHEPQANTTYATNLAMYRLWTDIENRVLSEQQSSKNLHGVRNDRVLPQSFHVRLRIEPLHQVHDALVGQFRKEDTTWAVGKIKSYFDNTLNIAGQKIVIPFEGAYGESWGELNEGKI